MEKQVQNYSNNWKSFARNENQDGVSNVCFFKRIVFPYWNEIELVVTEKKQFASRDEILQIA